MVRARNIVIGVLAGAVIVSGLAAGAYFLILRGPTIDEGRRAAPAPVAEPAEPPEARLQHARDEMDADHRDAAREWLKSLLADTGEPGHVAVTWLTTIYLQDHNLKGAKAAVDRIASVFDGEGLDQNGRRMPVTLYTEAFVDEAAAVARSKMEGPAPDVRGAREALQLGLAVSGDPHAVPVGSPILAAEHYSNLETAAQLREGIDGFPEGDGPRIIVFTDDFQFGEPILPSVLKRWSAGLTVGIVGRLTGHVRRGMRRVQVKSAAEEREAMSTRAKAEGLSVSAFIDRGGAIETRLGLPQDAGAVVFVLDKSGRIVARLSGNALDPRPLDPIVGGLVPDPSVIAPPR